MERESTCPLAADRTSPANDFASGRSRHGAIRPSHIASSGIRLCSPYGDSYHAASPQLGQGANMALLDAWALAKALRERDDIDEALEEFAASRRWHVRLYQTMSWLFTPVYQSDGNISPFLRDVIAAPLSHIPPAPYLLASMVAGTLGGPMKRLGLD